MSDLKPTVSNPWPLALLGLGLLELVFGAALLFSDASPIFGAVLLIAGLVSVAAWLAVRAVLWKS